MSAIGDYVHLHGVLYNIHGTNQSGQNPSLSATIAYKSEKDRLNAAMSAHHTMMTDGEHGEQAKLKENLARIFSKSQDTDITQYQRIIAEQLQRGYNSLQLGEIQWENGDVVRSKIQNERNKCLKRISLKDDTKEVSLKQLRNAKDRIVKEINELTEETESLVDRNQLQKTVDQITNLENLIEQKAEQAIEQVSDKKMSIKDWKSKYEDFTSVVENIDAAAKALVVTPPISREKGDLLEYSLYVAQAMGLQVGMNEIKETLQKSVETSTAPILGGHKESVELDLSNFTDSLDLKMANIQYTGKSGNKIVLNSNAQQKVDVQITLASGGELDRYANISAKNYNTEKEKKSSIISGVSILSGSSLLFLLQDADSDFVNHYLNLVSAHADDGHWRIPQTNLMLEREQAKMTILWEALSGDVHGRSSSIKNNNYVADTFVIHDSSKQGVASIQIYDIPTLAQKVMNNLDNMAEITANGKEFDNITFANAEASSYSERISKLLGSVHAQKISVALKPAAFRA